MSDEKNLSYWQALPGEWVEAPNERRGGYSGVQRVRLDDGRWVYRKQQQGHIFRSASYPLGYPTIAREAAALLECEQLGVRVPKKLFSHWHKLAGQWQALLVTEELRGFRSLDQHWAQPSVKQWDSATYLKVLDALGQMLGRFNKHRLQHGCLYPKHLFIKVEGGAVKVALIDLEKTRKRLLPSQAARHDLQQLWRRCGWRGEQWQAFLRGYQQTYGALPPLPKALQAAD